MLHEPRDIILLDVGMGEQPEGKTALAGLGARSPMHGIDSYRAAFWIPLPPGHPRRTRDLTRTSVVPDVLPIELAAIHDGLIEEVVIEWGVKKEAPQEWRIRAAKQGWWNLVKQRTGEVPGREAGAPVTAKPNGGPRGPDQLVARDFENRRGTVGI